MDARTVAALDVIAAFAVPNPGCSSQGSRFFRVWWLDELPRRAGHPAYFGSVNVTWTGLFGRRQFLTLVLPNRECCDIGHKFYEQACVFLCKKGDFSCRASPALACTDGAGDRVLTFGRPPPGIQREDPVSSFTVLRAASSSDTEIAIAAAEVVRCCCRSGAFRLGGR